MQLSCTPLLIMYKIVEEIKNKSINISPWIYSWNNHIKTNRPHLFLTKNDRIISALSKEFKNHQFFTYKYSKEYQHRKNIIPIYSPNSINDWCVKDNKLGFVIIDVLTSFETKNLLTIFKDYYDQHTVFYCPRLINFEGYETKVLDGIVDFCENYNLKIQWLAHNGKVELFDIRDIGYNQGVTFHLNKNIR